MPPIRSAKHLCPVCLKGYKTDVWLSKHIDQDHPRYRHQLELAARKRAETRSLTTRTIPAPPQTCTASGSIRERPPAPAPFYANHDAVNDPNAIVPDSPADSPTDFLPRACDYSQSRSPNTEGAPTMAFPDSGTPVAYVASLAEHNATAYVIDPYYPFGSEEEYNFAELVTLQGIPATVIDKMLKGNCGLDKCVRTSLKSNYHLRQKIDRMEDGLGHRSWKKSKLSMAWNEQHPDPILFWHRDLIACSKWILRQPAYMDHLVYSPLRSYNTAGCRVYDEMNTGDWWWDKQVSCTFSYGFKLGQRLTGYLLVHLTTWRYTGANDSDV